MQETRISIIIPVYNAEKYLRRGLDSLLAQTCGNWEAVCVDDGSTDNSLSILKEYAARDARFRVLRQENSGVSAARNRGIREARGEWVTFLDADDWFSPELVGGLLAAPCTERVDVIGFGTVVEYEEGVTMDESLDASFRMEREGEYPSTPETVEYMWGTCGGKAYRRDFLLENAITFPLGMRQEDEVFYRCAMGVARNFYLWKYYGYHYLQAKGSYMHVTFNPENCFMLYLKGADIIYDYYREHDLPDEWDETLLDLVYGSLRRWDGKVPTGTLNRFRRGASDFEQKAKFSIKFPDDIRVSYILHRPWWQRMFMRWNGSEVIYGIFGLPLFKDCYLSHKFVFRISVWSKLMKLMGKNRANSL